MHAVLKGKTRQSQTKLGGCDEQPGIGDDNDGSGLSVSDTP